MATLVPIIFIIIFIVMVIIVAEFADNDRIKHKGDVPSSVLERREKMSPYTMPSGMKVKPGGQPYSGHMDYSLHVPESLDDSTKENKSD